MEPLTPSPTPFAWVHKRDGRLVPFEPDRISRALFAAGESLGQPNVFMARELADSILHFLHTEASGSIPTTAQIADLVVKVVRELGQPALARAYADAQIRKAESGKQSEEDHRQSRTWKAAGDGWESLPGFPAATPAHLGPTLLQMAQWVETMTSPVDLAWRSARACLCDYTLREVYSRDLVAAQTDGLLTLTGLDTPLELGAQVLGFRAGEETELVEVLEEARSLAGEYVALDGPEYLLARPGVGRDAVTRFLRELTTGLRMTRLQAVINLNCAVPPPWAEALAAGPLFEAHGQRLPSGQAADLLDQLLEHLLLPGACGAAVRLDWHLGERDFLEEKNARLARLARLARRALEGAPVAFVFDRPWRPIALAEGLDRLHPTVLLTMGLHLPQLLAQAGTPLDPPLFLRKLGSLARLALSAGTQKRDFLRRHRHGRPSVNRGFTLDRARLVAVPVGLDHVTQALLGQSLCAGGPAREFARHVVQHLHAVLHTDAQSYLLDVTVDSPLGAPLSRPEEGSDPRAAGKPLGSPNAEAWPCAKQVAGLTPWDCHATIKDQLQSASPLHAVAGTGTVTLVIPEDRPLTPEELVAMLRYAWEHTEVVRLRLARRVGQQRQLTAPWETSSERALAVSAS